MLLLLILLTAGIYLCEGDKAPNRLVAEYGVNFRHVGKIHQNLQRITVVTAIDIPEVKNIKPDPPEIKCAFLETGDEWRRSTYKTHKKTAEAMCATLEPYIGYIQEKRLNHLSQINRLFNEEVKLLLPELTPGYDSRIPARSKRWIGSLIQTGLSGLITLAVESLGSFLRGKQQKKLSSAVENLRKHEKVTNKLIKDMKDDFLMYGRYNTETVEGIVNTIIDLENRYSKLEETFLGQQTEDMAQPSQMPVLAVQLALYAQQMNEEHGLVLKELEEAGHKFLQAITHLQKGYLPEFLFPPSRLREIMKTTEKQVLDTFPDYEIAIYNLGDFYDMKLVTFAVDNEKQQLIVSFPVFIRQKHLQSMQLFEIEAVHVPAVDDNDKADSYTKIIINKPFMATNNEEYITLHTRELLMCRRIRYQYFCEELFMIKDRTHPECAPRIYHGAQRKEVHSICQYDFYQDLAPPPTVLDGGHEILMANIALHGEKRCEGSASLGQVYLKQPYTVVDRNLLCHCQLEMEKTKVLRDLNACDATTLPKPVKHHVNTAMWMTGMEIIPQFMTKVDPDILNQTQKFPISLYPVKHRGSSEAVNLKQYLESWKQIEGRATLVPDQHDEEEELVRPITTLNILSIVGFGISILGIVGIALVIYKYNQLIPLIAAMTADQVPLTESLEIDVPGTTTPTTPTPEAESEAFTWFNIVVPCMATSVTLVGLAVFFYKKLRKVNCIKGRRHEDACTIHLLVFRGKRYTDIKLTTAMAFPSNLTLQGNFNTRNLKLTKNWIWDELILITNKVRLSDTNIDIPIPSRITIPIWKKFSVRYILADQTAEPELTAEFDKTWWTLQDDTVDTISQDIYTAPE